MQFRLTEYGSDRFVTADVAIDRNEWSLEYELSGISDILWPAITQSSTRRDELWKHTCLELFIADNRSDAYLEINLSPGGDWNCYAFNGYRDGMHPTDMAVVNRATKSGNRVTALLDVNLPWKELLLGPSAVIEDIDGQLSYFAVGHGESPDFHDRAYYVHTTLNRL